MALVTVEATLTRLVLDSLSPLTAWQASAIGAAGYPAVGRYVNLSEGPGGFALSGGEVALVTPKVGLFVIQEGRSSGWSETTGRADGLAAARNTLALGFPVDVALACDHEGAIPSKQASIDYGQAWWSAATSEGMTRLRLYVGEGVLLDDEELYQALSFRGYWRSPSQVPNVATRGYQAVQSLPFEQEVLGPGAGKFDVSMVSKDLLGGAWAWAKAA